MQGMSKKQGGEEFWRFVTACNQAAVALWLMLCCQWQGGMQACVNCLDAAAIQARANGIQGVFRAARGDSGESLAFQVVPETTVTGCVISA